jgi:hypothetical protein
MEWSVCDLSEQAGELHKLLLALQENPRGGRAKWAGRQLSLIRKLLGGNFSPIIAEGDGGVRERVRALKEFLDARPERVIVVVGHSAFFQQFLKTYGNGSFKRKLHNCEILRCADVGVSFSSMPQRSPLLAAAAPGEMRELTSGIGRLAMPDTGYQKLELAHS